MTTNPNLTLIRLKILLKQLWFIWLVFRLVAMSFVIGFVVPSAQMVGAVFWQMLTLLPALLSTPVILRANSPYALIMVSLLLMVYWAVSATQLLINLYQKAPLFVSVAYGFETIILMGLFFLLFLTTKKMPALHKQKQNCSADG